MATTSKTNSVIVLKVSLAALVAGTAIWLAALLLGLTAVQSFTPALGGAIGMATPVAIRILCTHWNDEREATPPPPSFPYLPVRLLLAAAIVPLLLLAISINVLANPPNLPQAGVAGILLVLINLVALLRLRATKRLNS